MKKTKTIAHRNEFADADCKSRQLEIEGKTVDCFIVLSNGKYYAYINQCPHTGVNLEWQANQFLDDRCEFIQCTTHGAKFRITDGYCVFGPCQGTSLKQIPIKVTANRVEILE